MYPRYSKDILQYHVLKLVEQGVTRADISKYTGLNLSRLFQDNNYFQSKSSETFKIVKMLHETGYDKNRELPETLRIVSQPASFNAYLLNSKNALEMFEKLISFNRACSPCNEYGWRDDGAKIEFYIKQDPREKEYCTTQGMIFYIVLLLKELLGEEVKLSVGACSDTYPDIKTFTKHGSNSVEFNQPDSFVRIQKEMALAPNNSYNISVSQYLKNQFQDNFKVTEPELELDALILSDIRNAVRADKDTRFFNVDFIATRLGLSRSTLYRKLQASNTSFTSIIEAFRKEESAALLKRGFMPLEEISEILGYSNLTAFNRAFRRWYNTSPAKFRDQL